MGRIYTAFAEELEKEGRKRRPFSFDKLVHHPLFQALGYGALSAEGLHALSEMGYLGRRAKRFTGKSRIGRGLGMGSIGVSSAFLGSEAASALRQFLKQRKRRRKK